MTADVPGGFAGGAEPSAFLAVGVIVSTHGIGGELKVKSLSGGFAHLLALRSVVLRKGGVETPTVFENVRRQDPGVIVKVTGLDTPERARALVGSEIWVPRAAASPLSNGEYYAADLCRCRLWFGEEEVGAVRSAVAPFACRSTASWAMFNPRPSGKPSRNERARSQVNSRQMPS